MNKRHSRPIPKKLAFCIGLLLSLPAQAILYQYDSLGRLIQVTSNDGTKITYEYDPVANLISLKKNAKQPLIVVGSTQNNLLIYNLSSPTQPIKKIPINSTGQQLSLAPIDIDQDGNQEIAVAYRQNNNIIQFYSPQNDLKNSFNTSNTGNNIVTGYPNNAQNAELVTQILPTNNTLTRYSPQGQILSTLTANNNNAAFNFTLGDINADNIDELIIVTADHQIITPNKTWSAFTTATTINNNPTTSSNDTDKVTICHKGKNTLTISRSALSAHLNHGDTLGACSGSTTPTPTTPSATTSTTTATEFALVTADFNQDKQEEIVLATANNDGKIQVFSATGSFISEFTAAETQQGLTITTANVLGDATPEILAAALGSNTITIFNVEGVAKATLQTAEPIQALAVIHDTIELTNAQSILPPDTEENNDIDTSIPTPTCDINTKKISRACQGNGQEFTGEIDTVISNLVLTGIVTLTKNGFISSVTIKQGAIVEGGKVSGFILNYGILKNFIFVGAYIKGGTLAGEINIELTDNDYGHLINVQLAANTKVRGGLFKESVIGSPEGNASIEDAIIADNTQLSYVTLGKNVKLGNNVKIGEGVRFTEEATIPNHLDLTIATHKTFTTNLAKAIDLNIQVVAGGKTILQQLTDSLKQLNLNITQNTEGQLEIVSSDSTFILLPVGFFKSTTVLSSTPMIKNGVMIISFENRTLYLQPTIYQWNSLESIFKQNAFTLIQDEQGTLFAKNKEKTYAARPTFNAEKTDKEIGFYTSDAQNNQPATVEWVFKDKQGQHRLQRLYATCANLQALQDYHRENTPQQALIVNNDATVVFEYKNKPYTLRFDYEVSEPTSMETQSSLSVIEKIDGTVEITYPNGQRQKAVHIKK